jgi:hypothetical protein
MAFVPLKPPIARVVAGSAKYRSKPSENARRILEGIGGLETGVAMALAAKSIYDLHRDGRYGLGNIGTLEGQVWPLGWEFLGWAGYHEIGQGMGRRKLSGTRCDVIAAALLTRGARRSEAMIAFRGTVTSGEWKTDLNQNHARFVVHESHLQSGEGMGDSVELGKTHGGFFHHLNATLFGHDGRNGSLARWVYDLRPEIIYITGHSLGGATCHLAALAMRYYANLKKDGWTPEIRLLSFAAPRVCNATFPPNRLREAFSTAQIAGVRIVNMLDGIPNVPGQSGAGMRFGLSLGRRDPALALAPLGLVVGGLGDLANLLTAVRGRWSHPSFGKLRFRDNGRSVGGHPHSMDLYLEVLLNQTHRLDRDLQDWALRR